MLSDEKLRSIYHTAWLGALPNGTDDTSHRTFAALRAVAEAAVQAEREGAVLASEAVAYLDLGVGGYIDIGSDLSDDDLSKLPKGRHILGIVGTYGVDGYVPAHPPQASATVPAEWQEIVRRLIGALGVMITDPNSDGDIIAARALLAQLRDAT